MNDQPTPLMSDEFKRGWDLATKEWNDLSEEERGRGNSPLWPGDVALIFRNDNPTEDFVRGYESRCRELARLFRK